ncbi:MAG: PadR family transcriptional regulator [Gemmatimonadetes bacterium]|nr:PadR family transcriptional regulator [Gemmatimonadota bacterium]
MSPRSAHDHLPLTPLTLAVLVALADEPLHGYAVLKALEARPGPRLVGGAGSLYAALQRMVDEGLLGETEGPGDDVRRRRAFALTRLGREVARAEMGRLQEEVRAGRERDLLPEGT